MKKYDIAIIGSGPAGMEIESMLNDPSKKICIIEKTKATFGGVCVNDGCMPTKHLAKCADIIETNNKATTFGLNSSKYTLELPNITKGKEQLITMLNDMHLSHTNADVIFGHGRFIDNSIIEITKENGDSERITADQIIIATGSRPKELTSLPVDGQFIVNSNQMLNNTEVPEKLLIVGGGVIALEFASIYTSYGSNVTIIEAAQTILPNEDFDTSMMAKDLLEKRGIHISTNTTIKDFEIINNKVNCSYSNNKSETFDKVLVAIGRTPNTNDIGLENTNITTSRGFIDVNEYLETAVQGVFAAGDVLPNLMLAHTAVYESMIITSNMKSPGSMKNNNTSVPRVIFSNPEIAGVGLTEEESNEVYQDVKVINFPMQMNGKNMIEHQTDGRIKLIFKGSELTLVGASIIGKLATELIHELTLAVTHKLTLNDLKHTIHAHPTTSEVIWFAAFKGMLVKSSQVLNQSDVTPTIISKVN